MKPHRFPGPRCGALALCMLAVAGLLAACSPGGAPGGAASTAAPTTVPTSVPSPTSLPAATDVPATPPPQPGAPEATAVPAGAATLAPAAPQPTSVPLATPPPMDNGSQPLYLDDRSSPQGVLSSFYNAIERREYARAYSYWEPDAAQQSLPPFAQWQQGYTGTQSVELQTGHETGGAAAGNIYASVPVGITAHQSDGSTQRFVGCYTLHMPNPGIESEPPTHPMGIRSATIRQVEQGADLTALLAGACPPQ